MIPSLKYRNIILALAAAAFALLAAPARGQGITLPVTGTSMVCTENQVGGNTATLNSGQTNPTSQSGGIFVIELNSFPPGKDMTLGGLVNDPTGQTGSTFVDTGIVGSDANGGDVQIFWEYITDTSKGTQVNLTWPTGVSFIGGCMFEVDGIQTSSPVDCAASVDHSSAVTPLLSPSCSVAHPNEFLLATSACQNAVSGLSDWTATNGGVKYTSNGETGDAMAGCPTGYFISSASGSYQAALLQSTTGTAAVAQASWIGASQPAGGSPAHRRFIQFGDWLPWPIQWLLGISAL